MDATGWVCVVTAVLALLFNPPMLKSFWYRLGERIRKLGSGVLRLVSSFL